MKRVMYAVLTLALLAPAGMVAQETSQAQPQAPNRAGRRHMPSVDDQLSRLSKKLKLTDEQKPQIKAILQDQHDQMQQVMQNSSGSREENWQKMREIHQSASDKIKTVLTDDQKSKYDRLEAKRQERMARHRRGGAGSAAPAANPPSQQ